MDLTCLVFLFFSFLRSLSLFISLFLSLLLPFFLSFFLSFFLTCFLFWLGLKHSNCKMFLSFLLFVSFFLFSRIFKNLIWIKFSVNFLLIFVNDPLEKKMESSIKFYLGSIYKKFSWKKKTWPPWKKRLKNSLQIPSDSLYIEIPIEFFF